MDSPFALKTIHCKAAVCWNVGEPLTVEEIEVDPPKKGEVRVKLVSTGICHTDLLGWRGKTRSKYPCILGHEGAGIVESVGELVNSVVAGDFVLLFVIGQCNECDGCKRVNSNYCLAQDLYTDINDKTTPFRARQQTVHRFFGVSSFSEYTVVNEARVGKINQKAKMDEVCLFSCGFSTGYGAAVNVAKVSAGSSVAIWGLGAVGLAAVYGACKKGAALVIGIDINEGKKEAALRFGCHRFINPLKCKEESTTVEEAIKSLTNGLGVDIAIDCAGGNDVVNQAINSTAVCGSVVLVGVSETPLNISPNTFLTGKKLEGVLLGGYKTREDIPRLVEEYVNGDIHVKDFITANVNLADINMAFEWLIQGKSLRTVVLF